MDVEKVVLLHSSTSVHLVSSEHQPQSKPATLLPRHEEQLDASSLQLYRMPASRQCTESCSQPLRG